MQIFIDNDNSFYTLKNRLLNNCITVIDNNTSYYYEFNINNNLAVINSNNYLYINEVVEYYHKLNPYVSKYRSSDNIYYQAFDDCFSFKLPLNILQVSELFLNKEKLELLDKLDIKDDIYLKVNIINDEYVLLSDHHLAKILSLNYMKLVNVYISNYDNNILDFIYLNKENNVTTIDKMPILENDEYNAYMIQLKSLF